MEGSRAKVGEEMVHEQQKPMPRTDPPAAGSQPVWPSSSAFSMAGMSSDHMLAAIITPAAKPSITRWRIMKVFLRNKKTTAAPAAVIRAVKPVPPAAQVNACNTM